MEVNWLLAGIVVAVNTALCFSQYFIQQWEVRRRNSKIPARGSFIKRTDQKFLYWQDFSTQTWGDLCGLVMPQIAFVHLWQDTLTERRCFPPLMALAGFIFFLFCLRKNHKPDWGYPVVGEASLGGWSHMLYFGANVAIGIIDIYHLFTGQLRGPLMWMALIGGGIWMAAFIQDLRRGRFDPIRYW